MVLIVPGGVVSEPRRGEVGSESPITADSLECGEPVVAIRHSACVASAQSSALTEIQRVPLIVVDDELSCPPSGFMHIFNKANSIFLQCFRRGYCIVCF